jgi:caffeoyl-CoA O-methyltransferase
MELVNNLAEAYAVAHTTEDDALLQEVALFTQNNHPKSHMLSGVVQGRLLQFLSTLSKPNAILEIGTFTGYSALCLAKGLQPNGQLHTIELRDQDAATANNFFAKSNHKNQIKLHVGNAMDIIPTLDFVWDMVFIDADKVQYSAYYDLILPKVKKGGLLIIDNVFFHGQVLEQHITGKNAIAIAAFNEKIKQDTTVDKVMLTVRDGLLLLLKK